MTREDENGCEVAVACECRPKKVMRNRLRFAELPEAYRAMDLKSFRAGVYRKSDSISQIGTACKIVKSYLAEFDEAYRTGMGLYLHSATKGTGKTRMVVGIANDLITRGKNVKFATSTSILNEIKRTWGKDQDYTESKLLDALCMADILIVDDFGTEKVVPWINDKFYHVVNERYIKGKVTLFTSNYKIDALPYDDRITSRVKEKTYQVAFPEESVREYIAEENSRRMVAKMGGGTNGM